MPKRSYRPPTRIGRGIPSNAKISGISDFVRALRLAGVERVMTADITALRTVKIGSGSQFTVYDDTGVGRYLNFPSAVVKCVNVELSNTPVTDGDSNRQRVLDTLQHELFALTHPVLRQHPKLLLYDLIISPSGKSIPTLVVERAIFGSLYDFLENGQVAITAQDRPDICIDITAGLAAIHRAGIVHGDVKADNVLIFKSPDPEKNYLAKISDFGSIIIIDDAKELEKRGRRVRYNGTKSTNAPETTTQSGENAINAEMLVRCDSYSLGLVYCHVLAGRWEVDWEAKDERVLQLADKVVRDSDIPQDYYPLFSTAVDMLLQLNPAKRCADLTTLVELLTPNQLCDSTAALSLQLHPASTRSELDISQSVETKFGRPDYLDFGWHDELILAKDIQHEIFSAARMASSSPEYKQSSRSYFELAMAYSIGFGTSADVDQALDMMLQAAKRQYLPARAMVHSWFEAHGREVGVHEEVGLNWLFEATSWGSICAGMVLRRKSLEDFEAAREQFHIRGGYNQYFYEAQAPDYIGSESFMCRIMESKHGISEEYMYSLLEMAAIYGDGPLSRCLLQQKGADPNYRNRFGESLLLLCSKGGHLDVMEALIEHGANASAYDSDGKKHQDSLIHWIVAFDNDEKESAANLLFQAGAELSVDISWNHPIIDYPGQFPLGNPLHFAAFCNDEIMAEILIIRSRTLSKLTAESPSYPQQTPSPLSPLEYATKFRRPSILSKLIAAGALEYPSIRSALADISTLPVYATWAANGSLGLLSDAAAEQCSDLLVKALPSLVDQPGQLGFTPIMLASYHHCETIVRHLIAAGCDVNARTPPQNDGRNALNLYSDCQLSYADDKILDLLHAAGANLEQGSTSAKKPLHFAARENNIRATRRLLELGAELHSRRQFGETPLHTAALYGSVEAGRVLLEMGAERMAEHWEGGVNSPWKSLTPLAFAVSRGQKAFIELLLEEYKVAPLARPTTGDTILHFAVSNTGGEDILKMLLEIPSLNGEVLHQKNKKGIAPLHAACGKGNQSHVEVLVKAGVDINQHTDSGHSPLDVACHFRDLANTSVEQGQNEPTTPPSTLNGESRIHVDSPGEALSVVANSTLSLSAYDEMIQLLERFGAQRASNQAVPKGLISLD